MFHETRKEKYPGMMHYAADAISRCKPHHMATCYAYITGTNMPPVGMMTSKTFWKLTWTNKYSFKFKLK